VNLKIGDTVEYDGRLHVVRGFTRVSSSAQHVVLEALSEPTTVVTVPLSALSATGRGTD